MLVVMAVIAVLAGILLPVLARAREQARRTECLNNLVQCQKALVIYGNSFSEYFPSHHCWGQTSAEYKIDDASLTNYADDYGLSRNMVVGYGAEVDDPATLAAGNLNFIPVGLGMLAARGDIGAEVLTCPGMTGSVPTYYGAAEYMYQSSFPKNVARSAGKPLATADGTDLHHTPTTGNKTVTALLSAYSYRNHPFYSRLEPDEVPDNFTPWAYTNDFDLQRTQWHSGEGKWYTWAKEWTLDFTKPGVKAEFMCPPFKSARQLGNRAIIADTFDYAPTQAGGQFKNGLGMYAHKGGYNVAYGDGHATWFDDENNVFANWKDWANTTSADAAATDNLTISSMSAQRAWNQLDQAAGIDKQ
jgi:prepilin-type processing-associated H-X9-DG protein